MEGNKRGTGNGLSVNDLVGGRKEDVLGAFKVEATQSFVGSLEEVAKSILDEFGTSWYERFPGLVGGPSDKLLLQRENRVGLVGSEYASGSGPLRVELDESKIYILRAALRHLLGYIDSSRSRVVDGGRKGLFVFKRIDAEPTLFVHVGVEREILVIHRASSNPTEIIRTDFEYHLPVFGGVQYQNALLRDQTDATEIATSGVDRSGLSWPSFPRIHKLSVGTHGHVGSVVLRVQRERVDVVLSRLFGVREDESVTPSDSYGRDVVVVEVWMDPRVVPPLGETYDQRAPLAFCIFRRRSTCFVTRGWAEQHLWRVQISYLDI